MMTASERSKLAGLETTLTNVEKEKWNGKIGIKQSFLLNETIDVYGMKTIDLEGKIIIVFLGVADGGDCITRILTIGSQDKYINGSEAISLGFTGKSLVIINYLQQRLTVYSVVILG